MTKYTKAQIKDAWYCAAVREEAMKQYHEGVLTGFRDYTGILIEHQCPVCKPRDECEDCGAHRSCQTHKDLICAKMSHGERVARMLWKAGGRRYA